MAPVLGLAQCINWGVLYYAFAVLVLPLQREHGVGTWVVTGAFSLALLASAAVAPLVGRWADEGRGAAVMHGGVASAAALLLLWASMPADVVTLYVIWAALGLCMAASLYEPAFVVVARAHAEPTERLRALAVMTLLGGLASTVFLPLTGLLVTSGGWRRAVVVLALLLFASVGVAHLAFRRLGDARGPRAALPRESVAPPPVRSAGPRGFAQVAVLFVVASFASGAFVTNLVPALGERGVSATAAALLGGFIGVMQLPGRALLMGGARAVSPGGLLAVCLLLQGVGLALALAVGGAVSAGIGVSLFAMGAGLTTLARPHLVQTLFAPGGGGYLNGRLARQQQLARAAAPITVAWLAASSSYAIVFTVLALALIAGAATTRTMRAGQ